MPSPEKFKKSLNEFGIDEKIISQINEGYENIVDKTPREIRADYFKRAADIMDKQVDEQKVHEIFELNACCKGGAREKASKTFAKANAGLTLDEKLHKIKEVSNMGEPLLNEDGTITVKAVCYFDGQKYLCACSNFNGFKYGDRVSKNYCYCCAGHFKHHYEIMLGLKLQTLAIESSPLESKGEKPCVIKYAVCVARPLP